MLIKTINLNVFTAFPIEVFIISVCEILLYRDADAMREKQQKKKEDAAADNKSK